MLKRLVLVAVPAMFATLGCNKSESPATGSAAVSSAPSAAPATPAVVEPVAHAQGMIDAFAAGNVASLWGALPPRYQSDVRSVIADVAGTMDAELYDGTMAAVSKLVRVLKEKKAFVLASLKSQQAPVDAATQAIVEKNWDTGALVLERLLSSEIRTVAGLKSLDPGKFLETLGTSLAPDVKQIVDAAIPNATQVLARKQKATLVKHDGDTAVVKVEYVESKPDDPQPEEQSWKKIDGRWLPAEMVESWDSVVAATKTEMSNYTAVAVANKAKVMPLVTTVDRVLDRLIGAKDQAEFDAAVNGSKLEMLAAVAPLMSGLSSAPAAGPASTAAPNGAGTKPPAGPGVPGVVGPSLSPPTLSPPK